MRPQWLVRSPIAHRGLYSGADCPENSLGAFQRAVSHGIPFEFDVQLTADGHLAVVHDADLERLTGQCVRVGDLDKAELQKLRVGPSGARIPTLPEVLEVVNGRVPFVIDVRRWKAALSPALERAVAAHVRGYAGPFAVQSFDPLAVLRLRTLIRHRPVGQVSGSLSSAGPVTAALGKTMITNVATWPTFISYELGALPSPFVRAWRRLGLPVLAWTVYSEAEEARAVDFADNFFFAGYRPRAYQKRPSRAS